MNAGLFTAWESSYTLPQSTNKGGRVQRVAELLDASKLREALVRLWVLGQRAGQLNDWEQQRDAARLDAMTEALADELRREMWPAEEKLLAAPLAAIRAIGRVIAESQSPYVRHRVADVAGKPRSFVEDGAEYWLLPSVLAGRRKAALARQVGNLATWFEHHTVVPLRTSQGIEVSVQIATSHVDEALRAVVAADNDPAVGAWVGHFDDGADVLWDAAQSPLGKWRTLCVEPAATRAKSIEDSLKSAADAAAQVVVFPEFSIDISQRAGLIRQLRRTPRKGLIFVVPGSFHEPMADGDAYNTAPLMDANGRTLFTHRKIRLFGDTKIGAEHVRVGNAVNVLLTPAGCLTVLICKDFMDAHVSVANLLQEVPVDWILVPSYGDETTVKAHKTKAKQLACVGPGASSVVANTRNTALAPDGSPLVGFAHACTENQPEEGALTGKVIRLPVKFAVT